MGWIFLVIGGISEMFGVLALKRFTLNKNWKNLILLVGIFGISLAFLELALRTVPMSIGYAVWAGVGAAGGVIASIIVYKESMNKWRLFFLSFIIIGVIGLRFFN